MHGWIGFPNVGSIGNHKFNFTIVVLSVMISFVAGSIPCHLSVDHLHNFSVWGVYVWYLTCAPPIDHQFDDRRVRLVSFSWNNLWSCYIVFEPSGKETNEWSSTMQYSWSKRRLLWYGRTVLCNFPRTLPWAYHWWWQDTEFRGVVGGWERNQTRLVYYSRFHLLEI